MGSKKYSANDTPHVSGQSNKPLSLSAHALTCETIKEELDANLEDGLSDGECKSRLELYGKNELDDGPGVQPIKILIRQVANAMMLVRRSSLPKYRDNSSDQIMIQVLILAMAVSFGIGSWIEGGVITAVIILNIVVGFFQEFNAEKTMDSLRSLSSPTASTVRAGKTETLPTAELVPGDMVELKNGDTVPADIR